MEIPLHSKLASLSLITQNKLASILVACGTKKDLIIHADLIKPLERVCGVSWLRQHGIEKIYKVDPNLGPTTNIVRVYLIPSSLTIFRSVLDQINSLISQNSSLKEQKCFHIIMVPKVLSILESILESKGLHGIVNLYTLTWDFMSMDEGILSLELNFIYKNVFIDQNYSFLSSIAMSLWSLTKVVSKPKLLFAIGKASAHVLDIYEVFNETYDRSDSDECEQEFGALVVIDRDQDYASGLLTPTTYSALLNEIFNVNSGNLELSIADTKSKQGKLHLNIGPKAEVSKTTPIALDSSVDALYGEIKYMHFSEVLGVLSAKAKTLKKEDVSKDRDLGIQEIKHFVANKLQQMANYKKNLVNHVVACETIISEMSHKFEVLQSTEADMIYNRNRKSNFNFIDENFSIDIHKHSSVRLMCLLSLTQGLTYEEYNSLVAKYLQAFGHNYLYMFNNLATAGLLIQPSSSKLQLGIPNLSTLSEKLPRWNNNFQRTVTKLKQLPSDNEKNNKTCPSFVFNGGYIPLIAIICKAILTSENFQELGLKLSPLNDVKIGGKVLDILKTGIETLNERLSNIHLENNAADLDFGCRDMKTLLQGIRSDSVVNKLLPLKPKSVLVYIIGGVTYAEIAACEVLRLTTGSKIVIASDSIISGNDLIKASM